MDNNIKTARFLFRERAVLLLLITVSGEQQVVTVLLYFDLPIGLLHFFFREFRKFDV